MATTSTHGRPLQRGGELAQRCGELRARIRVVADDDRHRVAHDVRFHNVGGKHLHHPVVGDLGLGLTRLDIPADHGLTIFTYAAKPGSCSEEALKLLGRRPPRAIAIPEAECDSR